MTLHVSFLQVEVAISIPLLSCALAPMAFLGECRVCQSCFFDYFG